MARCRWHDYATSPHGGAAQAGLVSAGRWLIDDLGAEYRADNPALSAELRYVLSVCAGAAPQPEVLMRTRDAVRAALGDDGVLLMPTMPDMAPLRAAPVSALEDYRNRAIRMLCIAGLSRTPQLSLPLLKRNGAPMGLSLLGPRGSDLSLIALAQRLSAAGLGA